MGRPGLRSLNSSLEKELPDGHGHESGVVLEIALPEPLGLGQEPIKPLHAALLPEPGRFASSPRVDVEGGTNAEHDGRNLASFTRHPALLLRAPEPNEENFRA